MVNYKSVVCREASGQSPTVQSVLDVIYLLLAGLIKVIREYSAVQVCLIWVSEGGRREEGVQCTEIAHPANIWEGGEEGGETTG